jgi:hypothetical protein
MLEDEEVLPWLDLGSDPAANFVGSKSGALALTENGIGFDNADAR